MPDGQDRRFEPVDGLVHIEQLASIGSRVHRKEEKKQKDKREKRRRKAGIEQTLEEEKKQLNHLFSPEDGHIDFHA